MIPQAKTRLGTLNDLVNSPESIFRQHSIHGRVFMPWGVFGTMYLVTSEAQYRKIDNLNRRFYAVFWVTFLILVVLLAGFGKSFHLGFLAEKFVLLVLSALIGIVLKVCSTAEATHNLAIAEARPPFLFALRQFASRQEISRLWFSTFFLSACCFGVCFLLRHARGDERAACWLMLLVIVPLALMQSAMILLHESPKESKGSDA